MIVECLWGCILVPELAGLRRMTAKKTYSKHVTPNTKDGAGLVS